jgi:hypothetical protein
LTLLLIIHISFLFSYFDTFLTWWSSFFDYFAHVNWHHLLLCKQDKQHTVTLACSMFIIHVPFCVKFSTFPRGDLFLFSLRLLGESANVFGISAAFAIVEMSRGGVTG